MTIIRAAMRAAILDDLFHGQPALEYQRVDTDTGPLYEVRGHVNPDRLGAFGADQLEAVIERRLPGVMARLEQGSAPITEHDIFAALSTVHSEDHKLDPERAAAILQLINSRQTYTPGFDDL